MDGRAYERRRRDEYEVRDRDLENYHEGERVSAGTIDMPFLILTLVILCVGVITVLTASFARAYIEDGKPAYYFIRQTAFALMGIVFMMVASRIPTVAYRRLSMWAIIAAVALLALVPFIGTVRGGARRWIDLGFTTFQPSELAKAAVVMSFASMMCQDKNSVKTIRGLIPYAGILLIVVGLLLVEPHLSASVIIICVGAIMLFVGGMDTKWFVIGGVAVAVAGVLLIGVMGYAQDRITAWLDPFSDPLDKGYQTVQSLLSIGSGGLLGLGLGRGRQKYLYLPEEHNDFIFSVYCEELGFIGAVLILILFAMLILRGYWIALHAKDKYGSYIATGITSLLAIQVFFNVAVVTNLVPCTGISLPFFSYGGTALLVQLAEMGMILSVSREMPLKQKKRRRRDADNE